MNGSTTVPFFATWISAALRIASTADMQSLIDGAGMYARLTYLCRSGLDYEDLPGRGANGKLVTISLATRDAGRQSWQSGQRTAVRACGIVESDFCLADQQKVIGRGVILGRGPHPLDRWNQESNQHSDERNHHQQFDQGEPGT